jgi:hypothetical protein
MSRMVVVVVNGEEYGVRCRCDRCVGLRPEPDFNFDRFAAKPYVPSEVAGRGCLKLKVVDDWPLGCRAVRVKVANHDRISLRRRLWRAAEKTLRMSYWIVGYEHHVSDATYAPDNKG